MPSPGFLTAARAAAESLMLDTCTITRGAGEPVWNDETGTYTTPAGETLYQGPCKVQTYQAFESTPEAGEQRLTIQRYYVHVPVGAVKYQQGDRILVTASPYNPALAGSEFVVQGAHDKSLQTAHRLLVDEVLTRG